MSRQYVVNGAVLVRVNNQEFGLTNKDGIVKITFSPHHDDIDVDAWGDAPPEIQYMNCEAFISMTLVHWDFSVFESAVQLMNGAAPAVGQVGRAGALMVAGGGAVSLQLSSPVLSQPWTFPYAYLNGSPLELPLGVRKSLLSCNWRNITYPSGGDPYQNGAGSLGATLYSHTGPNP